MAGLSGAAARCTPLFTVGEMRQPGGRSQLHSVDYCSPRGREECHVGADGGVRTLGVEGTHIHCPP